MSKLLYKISSPRADMTFPISSFWHTVDWESSTTNPRDGYLKDDVLYVGDFDEVSIHLFPRFRSIRVRNVDADHGTLEALGFKSTPNKRAHIFLRHERRKDIEAFRPTMYVFNAQEFEHIRRGEYVAYEPQTAISSEILSIPEAIDRWNIAACYVEDLDDVVARLRDGNIYFDEQT
tara:strand:+ start:18967 stop:19494 length:528 start_codon:yes stop_codon:yes gene_type:complete